MDQFPKGQKDTIMNDMESLTTDKNKDTKVTGKKDNLKDIPLQKGGI